MQGQVPGSATNPRMSILPAMADVLIVDDSAQIRQLLREFISPLGHQIREAGSAEDALALVVEAQPDVAFCDVHLTAANGLWLADQIRSVSPHTAMVLATGDSEVPPYESLRPGIVAYILEPFTRAAVIRAVNEGVQWAAASGRRRGRLRLSSGIE